MADYYPLIARAIAGLDPSAPGESRRALYERARAALIQQLRSVQPPLSESEITRERLSLEEAVRKVESEAAQRAREATRSGGARDAFRRAAPSRPQESGNPSGGPSGGPPGSAAPRPRPPAPPPSRDQRPPLGGEDRPRRKLRPGSPPPQAHLLRPPPGSRVGASGDRQPSNRARPGAVFPFKSAIAVGIVLILVGAGILWGNSVVNSVTGLFKPSPVVEATKDPAAPVSRPKIPDRVGQPSWPDQVAPVAQRT